MKDSSTRKAESAAQQLLDDLEIDKLPVNVFQIAERLNIPVVEKPDATGGVSGALIKIGNSFTIAYATHIDSIGFQRFSIGHELGHLHIEGHAEALLSADQITHESKAGYKSKDPYEREADDFSANLLMPKALFKQSLRSAGDGLSAIIKLSNLCETSRLATAIRYSNLTSEAMAIVVSEGTKICYSFLSSELKQFPDLNWLGPNSPIPDVPTAHFNSDNSNVIDQSTEEHQTPMKDWFGGNNSVTLHEEILGLGTYGRTLTILTSDVFADEGDEDADLEESLTPRFRK